MISQLFHIVRNSGKISKECLQEISGTHFKFVVDYLLASILQFAHFLNWYLHPSSKEEHLAISFQVIQNPHTLPKIHCLQKWILMGLKLAMVATIMVATIITTAMVATIIIIAIEWGTEVEGWNSTRITIALGITAAAGFAVIDIITDSIVTASTSGLTNKDIAGSLSKLNFIIAAIAGWIDFPTNFTCITCFCFHEVYSTTFVQVIDFAFDQWEVANRKAREYCSLHWCESWLDQ